LEICRKIGRNGGWPCPKFNAGIIKFCITDPGNLQSNLWPEIDRKIKGKEVKTDEYGPWI
jgi:hypothetical protein